MLYLKELSITVAEQKVLNSLSLEIDSGTIHAIMGPNGSGKSSLANAIAGHPAYVVDGSMLFNEIDLTELSPDKRAKAGIFVAFQNSIAIAGITVLTFLKEAHRASTGIDMPIAEFSSRVVTLLQQVGLDESFLHRSLNEGFSGGQKKRLEMVQILLLKPKLVILDEIDSGLDIDALKIVADCLLKLHATYPHMSIVIITHYKRLLEYIHPHQVHLLVKGNLVKSSTYEMVQDIEAEGYHAYSQTPTVSL